MMELQLTELNDRITIAEKKHNKQLLDKILSEDLKFRRANGKIVTKTEFLNQLPQTKYEHLDAKVLEVLPIKEDLRMVTLEVRASGTREGKPFKGIYLNTRFFQKEGNEWKLYAWYNLREDDTETKQYFSGSVWMNDFDSKGEPTQTKCRQVLFARKARTYWHIHSGDQQLFVTTGTAHVVIKGTPKITLNAGEHIPIPAGTMHWHGADEQGYMIHLAINESTCFGQESKTFWFEEVEL